MDTELVQSVEYKSPDPEGRKDLFCCGRLQKTVYSNVEYCCNKHRM